jgi:hypothetical protein
VNEIWAVGFLLAAGKGDSRTVFVDAVDSIQSVE